MTRLVAGAFLVLTCGLGASLCKAADATFTTDTLIGDGDFTYDGDDIRVIGCTLTVNGVHRFSSITLLRNGTNQPAVLTHAAGFSNGFVRGMHLYVQRFVRVQGAAGSLVESGIDLTGRGYFPGMGVGDGNDGNGAGGGGHGGAGGIGSDGSVGGATYATFDVPVEFGSSGGDDDFGTGQGPGGAGGGAMRLVVGGELRVDGYVKANGANGTSDGGDVAAGGGAGGSILVMAGKLSGAGLIAASGGFGGNGNGGGGGGGRVSVFLFDSLKMANGQIGTPGTFTGSIEARGGGGFEVGGAGTLYRVNLSSSSSELPLLLLDNGGDSGAATEFHGALRVPGTLVVRGGAVLAPSYGEPGLHLTIDGDLNVEADGSCSAMGRGHGPSTGPGEGNDGNGGGGGGYGGAGGNGSDGSLGGPPMVPSSRRSISAAVVATTSSGSIKDQVELAAGP